MGENNHGPLIGGIVLIPTFKNMYNRDLIQGYMEIFLNDKLKSFFI
jgi:hypothetical protein